MTTREYSSLLMKKANVTSTKGPNTSPLAALPAVQVVESRFTSSAVPAGDVRQAVALAGHRAAAALLPRGPVGVAIAG